MITIRDHQTGDLFDPWDHLGGKRRQLLERSWAGVFRDHLLEHLPVGELIARFSRQLGRPTKDFHMVLGADPTATARLDRCRYCRGRRVQHYLA